MTPKPCKKNRNRFFSRSACRVIVRDTFKGYTLKTSIEPIILYNINWFAAAKSVSNKAQNTAKITKTIVVRSFENNKKAYYIGGAITGTTVLAVGGDVVLGHNSYEVHENSSTVHANTLEMSKQGDLSLKLTLNNILFMV